MCPGQGSQQPGFLDPWLEVPGVRDRFAALSEVAGADLIAHGTTSDAATIKDTAIAQPLIVSASVVALRTLLDQRSASDVVDITAGHSVGELAAAAIAGVLDDAGAVALVTERARAMAEAAAVEPTGMAAVLGGDPDQVLAAIAAAGAHPANVNASGQVVAAGSTAALEALSAAPPPRARVVPLQVAGAFHTPYMAPARERFAAAAASVVAADPQLPLLSDADGAPYSGGSNGHGAGAEVLDRLVDQVLAPVRWDQCQQTLVTMGVTAMIEMLPGGVLSGLARREMRGVETVAVTVPEDLDAAEDLIRRHSVRAAATTSDEEGRR